MPVSIPRKKVEHKPLAKCRVLYLGSSVPLDTVQGLEAVQKPLRERYPLLDGSLPRDRTLQGIDSWVTVFSTGIQLQYTADANSFWFPIQNLYVSVAVKCITQTNGATGDVIARFVPLDSMGARVNNGHPPLFACILRRTKGVKVLECHGFVCKSEQASFALVQACQFAYEHKEGWDEEGNPPPVATLEMDGPGPAVNDKTDKTDVKLVPADVASRAQNGNGNVPRIDLSDHPPQKGYFFMKGDANIMQYKLSQNERPVATRPRGPPIMMRYPQARFMVRGPQPPPRMMRPLRPPPPRWAGPPPWHYGPPPPPPWMVRGPPPVSMIARPPNPHYPIPVRYAESDPGNRVPLRQEQEPPSGYLISRVSGDETSSRNSRPSSRKGSRKGSAGSSSSESPRRPAPFVADEQQPPRLVRSTSSSSDGSIPRRDRQQKSDRPPTPPADYDSQDRRLSRKERHELSRKHHSQQRPSYMMRRYPSPEYIRYHNGHPWGVYHDGYVDYGYDSRMARARSVPNTLNRRSSRSNSRNRKGGKNKKSKSKYRKSHTHSAEHLNGDIHDDIILRDPERVPELPRDWHAKQFMNEKAFSQSVPRIHDGPETAYPTAYQINQEFGERSELDRAREGEVINNPLYDTAPPPAPADRQNGDLENTLGYLP